MTTSAETEQKNILTDAHEGKRKKTEIKGALCVWYVVSLLEREREGEYN